MHIKIEKNIWYYLGRSTSKKWHFFNICFSGVQIKNLKSVFGGRHFIHDFLPIFNIKRQWGTRGETGVLRGGGKKPNIKQIVKKKKKRSKNFKNRQNRKKNGEIRFFVLLKIV